MTPSLWIAGRSHRSRFKPRKVQSAQKAKLPGVGANKPTQAIGTLQTHNASYRNTTPPLLQRFSSWILFMDFARSPPTCSITHPIVKFAPSAPSRIEMACFWLHFTNA
jgi:hypothetical protein